METIQTTAISQLVAELQEAVAWIESLGVRIGQGRFSTYARIASEWESFVGGGSALTVSYLYPRVATLAYEVPAFIKIFQTFRNIPNQHLEQVASMLRKAVHGALSIDDEHLTKPNPARDYLFEALTAAHVHRPEKGCNAIFDSPSDTGFTTGRHHVFIECKRLSSDAGLQANVKKAASQLNKAFQRRPRIGNRGLIALDVSRLIRPRHHLLSLPKNSHIGPTSTAMLTRLVNECFDELQRCLFGFDQRIFGFMVFCNFVAVAESEQIFVNVGRWSIVPRRGIDAADDALIANLPLIMAP